MRGHPPGLAASPALTLPARFMGDALENRFNGEILARLPALGLPDAWLVAGCLFQTVWNVQAGQAPTAHIKDYDLFYFDAADLSADAEEAVQRRLDSLFADLPVELEIKNQARVHLWYADYFGYPYDALQSSCDGVDRFLIACTCVGLQPSPTGRPQDATLYAPDGLENLYEGLLQPNPLCDHRPLFDAKAASYRARWPHLRVTGPTPT